MTKLSEDIKKQPAQILGSLRYALGPGRDVLGEAAAIVKRSSKVILVGIGSSWHAAMAAHAIFAQNRCPVFLWDASELLHFSDLPPDSAVILLSRSGKSVEIVRLLEKCRASAAKMIAITNATDSPLAQQADVVLPMMAEFDHQVSISMYSVLAMIAALLACEAAGILGATQFAEIEHAIAVVAKTIPEWTNHIKSSGWLAPEAPVYFLARGPSLASAYESRLLWEEVAKAPASALPTGSFRHGSQEMVRPGIRIGLWIDPNKMRDQDMALATDLQLHGARVLAVGQGLVPKMADLVLNIPSIPSPWQFLVDIIPLQIAAEHLSKRRGEDCDSFRLCSYIVETEGGLEHVV